jgi:hypothetical protein
MIRNSFWAIAAVFSCASQIISLPISVYDFNACAESAWSYTTKRQQAHYEIPAELRNILNNQIVSRNNLTHWSLSFANGLEIANPYQAKTAIHPGIFTNQNDLKTLDLSDSQDACQQSDTTSSSLKVLDGKLMVETPKGIKIDLCELIEQYLFTFIADSKLLFLTNRYSKNCLAELCLSLEHSGVSLPELNNLLFEASLEQKVFSRCQISKLSPNTYFSLSRPKSNDQGQLLHNDYYLTALSFYAKPKKLRMIVIGFDEGFWKFLKSY